jgi:cysteine sulfinate desulfinase/cysteine desulfurase-like protein
VFTGSGTEADQIPLLSVLRSAYPSRRSQELSHCRFGHRAPRRIRPATLLEKLGVRLTVVNPAPTTSIAGKDTRSALSPYQAGRRNGCQQRNRRCAEY